MAREIITPHLWYDKEAKEAAEFYVSAFGGNSKINNLDTMEDTPSGSVDIVSFEIWGHQFVAMSAGPHFELNPSISFMVNFDPSQDEDARERIDQVWEKLSPGGKPLMPLDRYDFSERYGWIKDRFGVSRQIVPENMGELMGKNPEQTTPVMLQMKKIIIADLEKASKE